MNVDKLIEQSSSPVFQRQRQRLLRLCSLCGQQRDNPIGTWNRRIQWFSDNNYFNDLNRIDRQFMEFEWKIFPRLRAMEFLQSDSTDQQMMAELQCEPENFTGRIIFLSMFTSEEICENSSQKIPTCARRFPRGHWSFPRLGSEKKWRRAETGRSDGLGTKMQRK